MMRQRTSSVAGNGDPDSRSRRRRFPAGVAVAVAVFLAATPSWALFLTTYGEFAQMSAQEQQNVVDSAIYEVIQYFVSTKRDNSKSLCVGRYFSGNMESNKGGYRDLRERLDIMKEQYDAGTLGTGEDSYVERVVLKLIKDECGV
jgi:hypothetical protein